MSLGFRAESFCLEVLRSCWLERSEIPPRILSNCNGTRPELCIPLGLDGMTQMKTKASSCFHREWLSKSLLMLDKQPNRLHPGEP